MPIASVCTRRICLNSEVVCSLVLDAQRRTTIGSYSVSGIAMAWYRITLPHHTYMRRSSEMGLAKRRNCCCLATVTVARVCIRLPYTDLVNEMHLENWAGIQDQRQNSNQCR